MPYPSLFSNRYIDEMDSIDNFNKYETPPLMCLVEEQRGGMGVDEKVRFGMVAICPSSGEIVWDEFDGEETHSSHPFLIIVLQDTHMRTELEVRRTLPLRIEIRLNDLRPGWSTRSQLNYYYQTIA
jgi:DNA mismatch repair protein MSH3